MLNYAKFHSRLPVNSFVFNLLRSSFCRNGHQRRGRRVLHLLGQTIVASDSSIRPLIDAPLVAERTQRALCSLISVTWDQIAVLEGANVPGIVGTFANPLLRNAQY